jgi:hypothetical protein
MTSVSRHSLVTTGLVCFLFPFFARAYYVPMKVFDTIYNGFSTDELYFVRVFIFNHSIALQSFEQFNHDFGGPPWERKSRETAEKCVRTSLPPTQFIYMSNSGLIHRRLSTNGAPHNF